MKTLSIIFAWLLLFDCAFATSGFLSAETDAINAPNPSSLIYVCPPAASMSIPERNLYPLIVNAFKANGFKVTTDKWSASYWVVYQLNMQNMGNAYTGPSYVETFGLRVAKAIRSQPVAEWPPVWDGTASLDARNARRAGDFSDVVATVVSKYGTNYSKFTRMQEKD